MHDMIKFTKPKIVRISILIIFALGMVSFSRNLPTIEKAMAICFDTPFCDTPHTTFSFGRLHTGDLVQCNGQISIYCLGAKVI